MGRFGSESPARARPFRLLLYLGAYLVRVGIDLFHHPPDYPIFQGGVEQVLVVEVDAPPITRPLGSTLQERARRVGEKLGYVHLLRPTRGG